MTASREPTSSRSGGQTTSSILRTRCRHPFLLPLGLQYFMGSAYSWTKERETASRHTVPREIVSKIIEKMEKDEPFVCYVVIPMFPEGDPTSAARLVYSFTVYCCSCSQEILYWQQCTIESMYWRIANAIKEQGLAR